jgi:hypothetical protein
MASLFIIWNLLLLLLVVVVIIIKRCTSYYQQRAAHASTLAFLVLQKPLYICIAYVYQKEQAECMIT